MHRTPVASAAKNMGGESAYSVLAKAKELERGGRSIIHLEIGQPDFETPKSIVEAAVRTLRGGHTKYTPSLGIPELRQAIADSIEEAGGSIHSSRIAVTPSGKTALFLAMAAVINPGDEVIYPDPGFPSYRNNIVFLGGVPRPLPILESRNFSFDVNALHRLISRKTKLIIINSPGNPTGSVMPKADLLAIAEISRKKDIFVLTDEIYSKIVYDAVEYPSFYGLRGASNRTFLVNGFSKSFSMTGWRLGYLAAPRRFMQSIDNLAVNLFGCTAGFTQCAGLQALTSGQDQLRKMVREFQERRNVLVRGLNGIKGVRCPVPGGAFYVFPNIKQLGRSSSALADLFLEKAGVALLPGTAFGSRGEGYLRISYATSLPNISRAVRRIKRFVETEI